MNKDFLIKRFNLQNDILIYTNNQFVFLRLPYIRKVFNSLLDAYIYFRKNDKTK